MLDDLMLLNILDTLMWIEYVMVLDRLVLLYDLIWLDSESNIRPSSVLLG